MEQGTDPCPHLSKQCTEETRGADLSVQAMSAELHELLFLPDMPCSHTRRAQVPGVPGPPPSRITALTAGMA